MWIDLDDEDCKVMIYQELDTKGHPTRAERVIIPAFNLHSCEVGDGNGKDRVTTFAYKIRCAPTKAYMLKNLLCKINDEYPYFKFIAYGLNTSYNESNHSKTKYISKRHSDSTLKWNTANG